MVSTGQIAGLREVDDLAGQVSFVESVQDIFDEEQDRMESGPDPFTPDAALIVCPE